MINPDKAFTPKMHITDHGKDFETFVGPLTEEDDFGLCSGCHDYPCCCTADEAMLHDDWQAEIEAKNNIA